VLSTGAFLQAMIPLYFMTLIGFFSKRKRILNKHANLVITQMMLYITLPALILYSLNTNLTKELLTDFIWLIIMSIFVLSVSIFIGFLLRIRSRLPINQKSAYESLIIFGNQGFIGFAVSYILLKEQGIIYLTIFNICYLILIWTYGIYLFTKNKHGMNRRLLVLNPGILSTLIGLIILFLPFKLPLMILETFESIGKMTILLSMILIGSLLAEIDRKKLIDYSKNIYIWIAASWKLIILPLFLFVFLLFNVSYPLIVVAVLTAAMPSAPTTTVYAQKFGGDVSFASVGVILSTLLCIITIPLLYTLLQLSYSFLKMLYLLID